MIRKTLSKITNLIRNIRPGIMASPEKVVTEKISENDQKPKGKRAWVYDNKKKEKEPGKKKARTDVPPPMEGRQDKKRKVALLLAYCGKGYYGIQKNPGFPTIESELVKALCKVEAIPEDHAENFHKMSFQRAARTDKGVSAVAQVVSLKMLLNIDNLLDKINENLPSQIRVLSYIRTTNGFDSKHFCSSRTYSYMLPTFAFAPFESTMTEDYRMTDDVIAMVDEILTLYHGTHNFHNYTSGVKPSEACAKRYIMKFYCGKPFVQDDMEFVILTVKGQSFMMHHIRKMIGITIAIVKGLCGKEVIEKSWGPNKVDIPKAPGLGLLLYTTHYDGYNKRYGNDGLHQAIEWTDVKEKTEQFQNDIILPHIIATEKKEKSMINWLGTLTCHDFDIQEEGSQIKEWSHMKRKLKIMDKEAKSESNDFKSPNCKTDEMDETKLPAQEPTVEPAKEISNQSSSTENQSTVSKNESDTVLDTAATEPHQFEHSEFLDKQTNLLSQKDCEQMNQSESDQKS